MLLKQGEFSVLKPINLLRFQIFNSQLTCNLTSSTISLPAITLRLSIFMIITPFESLYSPNFTKHENDCLFDQSFIILFVLPFLKLNSFQSENYLLLDITLFIKFICRLVIFFLLHFWLCKISYQQGIIFKCTFFCS